MNQRVTVTVAVGYGVVCVLSVVLLYFLGTLGEVALNFAHRYPTTPTLARFVLKAFPLNRQLFQLSLTPFMILFLALPSLAGLTRQPERLFWVMFVGLWLVVAIYLSAIVILLLAPFCFLMIDARSSFVEPVVITIDVLLVCSIGGLCAWRGLKRWRAISGSPPPERK